MSAVPCPHCGRRHETATEAIEVRTSGVTEDWQTWVTVTCAGCGAEFIYRTE